MAINEAAFYYPSDLVNTKTTIPLRVGEERWIYTSPSGDSCMLYVGTSKMTPRVLAVWAETLRGQKLTGLDLKNMDWIR